ncbi:MAG: biotin/lipoyl-binding protein, partial [Verrucomicrobiota bacterium]
MSDDTTPAEKPKPKLHPLVAKLLWPLVALGAIGFGWFGYTEWQFEKNRISTDNAQVKGEIIKIFSPEQGYIEAIHVEDNDAVLKGQVLVELANDFYQLQVDQAEANYNLLQAKQGDGDKPGLSDARLESAEANLELIKTQLSTAQDQLRDAQQVVKDLQEQK